MTNLRLTPNSARVDAVAGAHPWLKSYPTGVDWGMRLEPALLGGMLDAAVAAYGARPCTYFFGRRLSFAEIGRLSDRAAKGLQDSAWASA